MVISYAHILDFDTIGGCLTERLNTCGFDSITVVVNSKISLTVFSKDIYCTSCTAPSDSVVWTRGNPIYLLSLVSKYLIEQFFHQSELMHLRWVL